MYGKGVVLGGTSTAAGIAVLPKTGSHTLISNIAIVAIVVGVTAVVLQLGVALYRRSLRTK